MMGLCRAKDAHVREYFETLILLRYFCVAEGGADDVRGALAADWSDRPDGEFVAVGDYLGGDRRGMGLTSWKWKD
jgi:hypothetical protein